MHKTTKPKVLICPQCGSGVPPRRKGSRCIDCTNDMVKTATLNRLIKKAKITRQTGRWANRKPRPKS